MEKETWRPVIDFEEWYEVSDMGYIRSIGHDKFHKGRILKPKKNRGGYNVVCLRKDNKNYTRTVHRTVLEAFVGKSDLQVSHLNDNKQDNRLENLCYMTPKENNNWGSRNEKISKANRNDPRRSKPVRQLNLDYSLKDEFPSSHEAERQTGIHGGSIRRSCKTGGLAGGFYWEYIN